MRRLLLLIVVFAWTQSIYASAEGGCLDGNKSDKLLEEVNTACM